MTLAAFYAALLVGIAGLVNAHLAYAKPESPALSSEPNTSGIPPETHDHESIARAWRKYSALSTISRSEARRVGELDATLGVIAAAELTIFVWLMDRIREWTADAEKSHHDPPTLLVWTNMAMLVPIALALFAALFLSTQDLPEAEELADTYAYDEFCALDRGAEAIVLNSRDTAKITRYKKRAVMLSVLCFCSIAVAARIVSMVRS